MTFQVGDVVELVQMADDFGPLGTLYVVDEASDGRRDVGIVDAHGICGYLDPIHFRLVKRTGFTAPHASSMLA